MEPPSWLDALEKRMGGWAVPHLTRVLILFNIFAFFLIGSDKGFAGELLFYPEYFLAGDFWRPVTFLFVVKPEASLGVGTFFFFITMLFFWFIGEALEDTWGAFKLNFFIILSVVGVVIVTLVMGGELPKKPFRVEGMWVYHSMLIAFGTLYPTYELRLLFIPFPIYAKWIALMVVGYLLLECLEIPIKTPLVLGAMLGYFVVIGPAFWAGHKERKESEQRMRRFRGEDE